jgi:hypothetical protein
MSEVLMIGTRTATLYAEAQFDDLAHILTILSL